MTPGDAWAVPREDADALLRFVLASTNVALVATRGAGAQQRVIAASDALARMALRPVCGMTGLLLAPALLRPLPDGERQAAARGRGPARDEAELVRGDGSLLRVDVLERRMPWTEGQPRSVWIVRDRAQVTARRKHRAELSRLGGLRHLAGGVAHDFNNFLAAIMANLDGVAESLPPDSAEHRLVANSLVAVERAAALTSRLQKYAGEHEGPGAPLRLTEFVTEVASLLGSALGGGNRLRLTVPADLPLCRINPGELTSALLNLVVNARDAMPGGGVVTIGGFRRTLPQDWLAPSGHLLSAGDYGVLSIDDTGPGIPPQMRERVFETLVTSKEGSSGMGLPMVRRFVRDIGGEVLAADAAPQGARIELLLPAWPA